MSSLYQFEFITRGSGIYCNEVAGETLGRHKVVYRNNAGTWSLADADLAATMPIIGITMGAIPNGNKGEILLQGYIGDAAWTWTSGDSLYGSTVAGEITAVAPVAPDIIQIIAVAVEPDLIYFASDLGSGGGGAGECPILEGATAYVGTNACREPHLNYFLTDGVADDVQINAAEAYVTALGGFGGTIMLEKGTYVLAAGGEIAPTGSDITYIGQGASTFINGDALLTGEHAFNISGQTDCTIRDLMVQTEDGGGKTSHCVYIEDGANRFLIDNVLFLASDDQGVHIEGAATVGGSIINCEFISTDGTAIMVDMDGGADLMTLLEIKDNNIASAGAEAIELNDTEDSMVVNNIIATSGADGILLETTADNNLVEGNSIRNWTGEPIDDDGQENVVKGNDLSLIHI